MAMKKIKYPKTPKKSASVQVWERHLEKCKEVDKKNTESEKEAKKKLDTIKKVLQLKK